jgi:2-aminoethylphosphonate-pyruvate transaminase
LKARGFVIYPGKITDRDTFRIGNICDIHALDMHHLIDQVAEAVALPTAILPIA